MTAEWSRVSLSSLIEFTRDGEWGFDQPRPGTVQMLVIRGTDFAKLRTGTFKGIPTRYVGKAAAQRKRLQAGDVLIETAGGTRDESTGRTALVKQSHVDRAAVPLTCASFARFMRFDRARVDPRFAYWWLQSLHASGELEMHQVQHTGVARFQFTRFAEETLVPLPGLREQRAIVQVLDALDDKIELNRRMSETLEAIARALFKSWFVDFDPVLPSLREGKPRLSSHADELFPDSFEDSELGKVPKQWMVKTIDGLADIVGGSTPSTDESTFWVGGTHAWATPKDLSGLSVPVLLSTERQITDSGLAKVSSGLLPVGTVLLSSRAPIGYLAITEVPVAINQGFIAMVPKSGTSNLFLLFWAGAAHHEIISRANGSTFLEISKASFRPIPLVIPPSRVMQRFDELARPLYDRIVESVRESRMLAEVRDALLPKLISGELRVPDADRIIGGIA